MHAIAVPFRCGKNWRKTEKTELKNTNSLQIAEYIKNIEKLTFWASDNRKLHTAKQELLSQIDKMRISITAKDFFAINRPFLAAVSSRSYDLLVFSFWEYLFLQMATVCCTYVIISIQFYHNTATWTISAVLFLAHVVTLHILYYEYTYHLYLTAYILIK